jgi:hypothetical protein
MGGSPSLDGASPEPCPTHLTLTVRNLSLQVNCLYFSLLYLGVGLFRQRKVELALDGF